MCFYVLTLNTKLCEILTMKFEINVHIYNFSDRNNDNGEWWLK